MEGTTTNSWMASLFQESQELIRMEFEGLGSGTIKQNTLIFQETILQNKIRRLPTLV
jgi:hypothetical protein